MLLLLLETINSSFPLIHFSYDKRREAWQNIPLIQYFNRSKQNWSLLFVLRALSICTVHVVSCPKRVSPIFFIGNQNRNK